jgi:flavodoxin I
MGHIGVFYGSTTGNTESAATEISEQLGNADLFDIGTTPVSKLNEYDVLVLGASTWGIGDLQDDWEDVLSDLSGLALEGKKVALFGEGDQYGYEDTFCDALGILYEALEGTGAEFVGAWPTEGYDYLESRAEINGKFAGLVLDEDNQDDMTAERIAGWVARLKAELGE